MFLHGLSVLFSRISCPLPMTLEIVLTLHRVFRMRDCFDTFITMTKAAIKMRGQYGVNICLFIAGGFELTGHFFFQ